MTLLFWKSRTWSNISCERVCTDVRILLNIFEKLKILFLSNHVRNIDSVNLEFEGKLFLIIDI